MIYSNHLSFFVKILPPLNVLRFDLLRFDLFVFFNVLRQRPLQIQFPVPLQRFTGHSLQPLMQGHFPLFLVLPFLLLLFFFFFFYPAPNCDIPVYDLLNSGFKSEVYVEGIPKDIL